MLESATDLLIVIIVAVVLFAGASKIPELFHSLGRAAGEYKKGKNGVGDGAQQNDAGVPGLAPAVFIARGPEGRVGQAAGEAEEGGAGSRSAGGP